MPYIGNEVGNRFVASKAASVYSGDGSTTAFTLEHAVGSDEDILVSVDGVVQEPSVAYAVSSGTTLTFTAAPSTNSGNNIFVYYLFRTIATVDHPATSALTATSGTFSTTLASTGNATVGGTLGVTGATSTANINSSGTIVASSVADQGARIERNGTTGGANIDSVLNSGSIHFRCGTNEFMKLDSTGALTIANQPAFHVHQGGTQSNISPNSNTTITFANEIFDNNSDFASNTFTAPLTGKYQINATVRMDTLDIDTPYVIVNIVTSNRSVQLIQGTSGFDADQLYQIISGSHVMDMDANDTVTLAVNLPGGGASQADISDQTRFSGYLVC